jgi:hypothetical protein
MDAVKHYLRLCWFDVNPLELKKSTGFLRLNLVFFLVVQYFLQTNLTDDPLESLSEVAIEFLLMLGFIGTVLFFDKKLRFYVQVTSAIFFSTNFISLFFIPVIVWLSMTDAPLSYYVISLLVLWLYNLVTYIIKTVLAIDWLASFALSLLYFMVVYLGALSLGQL